MAIQDPSGFQVRIQLRALVTRGLMPLAILGLITAVVVGLNLLLTSPVAAARGGTLDLRQWVFTEHLVMPLAGEWSFTWDALLPAEAVTPALVKSTRATLPLPGVWNGREWGGSPLPAEGRATLALRVLLPMDGDYLLKVPTLTNTWRLYIDGQEKVANPWLEDLQRQEHIQGEPRLVPFTVRGGEAVIVFHVANWRHRAGGIWEKLEIAPAAAGDRLERAPVWRDLLLSLLLAVAGVYLVWLAGRESGRGHVFLAMFAFAMALRGLTVDERLLFRVFEIADWHLQQRIEFIVLYLSGPAFGLYIWRRFPDAMPGWLHIVAVTLSLALIALALVTEPQVFSSSVVLFHVLVLVYAFLLIGALVESVREGVREQLILLAGFLVFIAACVHDILSANNLVASSNSVHGGVLVFLVFAFFSRQARLARVAVLAAPVSAPGPSPGAVAPVPHSPLEQAMQQHAQAFGNDSRRVLCVEALREVLLQWERLGGTRITLAEGSGQWRITNDDGTLKTRTLDKYLRPETLPANPRWRNVLLTIDFLLGNDGLPEDARLRLGRARDLLAR